MAEVSKTQKSSWRRKGTFIAFLFTTALVTSYYFTTRWFKMTINESVLTLSWTAFYLSCLGVVIFGCKESHALEGVVYLITIASEAVLPGLCVHLMSHLHVATQSPIFILELTAHLMLTLMACALLIGWGAVLTFQYMGKGNMPYWVRGYVLGAIVIGFVVLLWAVLSTEKFVDLENVSQNRFIPTVRPQMYNVPMSYARIGLTILTMFLPWLRTQADCANGQASAI